ncbi:MAG: hypothetical protein A2452_05225 [Candidatus Firestonebacteria bacterium RIFOXYC2_FULL_39_67]|nr:MAG: hypothetical protein A2536_11045 [Candidatus Firestonebacteria bacterium RIFOXYD2_FULL_39_29]OGF52341.1 MAG: hypothetical protein A2497_03465 [Candidatus Firestonebacteria bacterium RifOxyC12_full_39_7]OGF54429.1 MAG: hypothetical protein A2452_05225 [Candidatus Firestonebacteria bacterium RIFOXYC2_FULL_39_67]
MNEFILKAELKLPVGKYLIRVTESELFVSSGFKTLTLKLETIKAVKSCFAVPAKGGGYLILFIVLKEGSEITLFQSEGYEENCRFTYNKLGQELASKLGVPFREETLGADA